MLASVAGGIIFGQGGVWGLRHPPFAMHDGSNVSEDNVSYRLRTSRCGTRMRKSPAFKPRYSAIDKFSEIAQGIQRH